MLRTVLVILGFLSPAAAPTFPQCPNALQLRGGGSVQYCSNVVLDGTVRPAVRRIVVVVHGNARNAAGAYGSVVSAAQTSGVWSETVVIAPHFQPPSAEAKAAGQLAWGDGWKEGGRSSDENSPLLPRRSSFEVVDVLLASLAMRVSFPNLREIVLAGHSAGGQFAQRHAALSSFTPPSVLHLRYVAANAGSYMYLNGKRWINGAFRGLDELMRLRCQGWDNYKYGLDKRDGYVGQSSASKVRLQFPPRLVTYLLGEDDTVRDGELDTGCEADLQGKHRLRRGELFFRFMNRFHSGHRHQLVRVPKVDHDASDMYTSLEGRGVLFGPLPAVRR